MRSEHVEVLRAMLRKCVNERLARKSADREAAALAAAIEALKSAPQPEAVDEAMVERAARAWCDNTTHPFDELPEAGKAQCLEDMRAALTAALASQPGGSDNDR